MAAVSALRASTELAAFGQRLIQAGKPFKAAATAVMRKLVILANAVLARVAPYKMTPA